MIRPSERVKRVYHKHIEYFGEPSLSIRYDHPPGSKANEYPPFVDIMVWPPEPEVEMTTFASIGMSDKLIPDAEYSVELHFSQQGVLSEETIEKTTIFLANLSLYPFMNSLRIDWWHVLANPGIIPGFSNSTSLMFHPSFVENGWDSICTDTVHVKILNVVPITNKERLVLVEQGRAAFQKYLYENEINLFVDRESI